MKEWIFEPQRLQRLAAIFICAYFLSLAIKLGIDPAYLHVNPGDYPIDFSWIWAAGRAVASGNGGQVYNFDYFSTAQIETFGAQIKTFPYVYPPTLLLYLAPLGLFPIFPAMVLWLFATFAAAWAALRRIAPAAMLTLLGTAPAAAAWTFQLGHTGFLGTALIGFALALIPESPFTGGLVLGLLTYKPQLGVIFPIVLLASRQWRVLLGATASTVALVAVTALVFGADVWLEFFASLLSHMTDFLPMQDMGLTGLQTIYGLMIWLGCSVATAKIIHLCIAAPMTAAICLIWRRPAPYGLKAAALGLGALVATPYLIEYDLVALAVPVAFLLAEMRRSGFCIGECSALFVAWLMLFAYNMPIGSIAIAILFALVIRRVSLSEVASMRQGRQMVSKS